MPGLESKTVTIDGHSYRLTMLPGSLGRGLSLRLQQVILPALAEIGKQQDSDPEAFFMCTMARGLANLTEGFLADLCQSFGASTDLLQTDPATGQEKAVKLTGAIFDIHFAGRYSAMFDWLVECVKFNRLADFLGSSLLGSLGQTE